MHITQEYLTSHDLYLFSPLSVGWVCSVVRLNDTINEAPMFTIYDVINCNRRYGEVLGLTKRDYKIILVCGHLVRYYEVCQAKNISISPWIHVDSSKLMPDFISIWFTHTSCRVTPYMSTSISTPPEMYALYMITYVYIPT